MDLLKKFESLDQPHFEPVQLPRIAIGNPPYGAKQVRQLENAETYYMAYRWDLIKDESEAWNPRLLDMKITSKLQTKVAESALFVEQYLDQLGEGEIAVLLVDNGILSMSSAEYFRGWLRREKAVLIASIGVPTTAWQVECGLSMNTGILLLQRTNTPTWKQFVLFLMIETCGYSSRGKRIPKRDPEGNELRGWDDDIPTAITCLTKFLKDPEAELDGENPEVGTTTEDSAG